MIALSDVEMVDTICVAILVGATVIGFILWILQPREKRKIVPTRMDRVMTISGRRQPTDGLPQPLPRPEPQPRAKPETIPVDLEPRIRELIEQIDKRGGSIWAVKALNAFGARAAPAIPALGRFYERCYEQEQHCAAVVEALKAIGPAGAAMLKHVEAIYALNWAGRGPVCCPCERKMERKRGYNQGRGDGYQCPNCGRFLADSDTIAPLD